MSENQEPNESDSKEPTQNNLNDLFIIEGRFKEDEIKEHYKDIALNAWESWHLYREDMDKILYFGGTMFITIITSTGLITLFKGKELYGSINVFQILVFHFTFLIIFLAHSYKRLISDISYAFARRAEGYYQDRFNELLDNKFEFISIKNHLTKPGRILLKSFNFGIIIIYIFTTSAPFIRFNFENGFGFEIVGWGFFISLMIFIFLLAVAYHITESEIRKVRSSIYREFHNHLDKIKTKTKKTSSKN